MKRKEERSQASEQQQQRWLRAVTVGKAAVTLDSADATWPTTHPCFSVYPRLETRRRFHRKMHFPACSGDKHLCVWRLQPFAGSAELRVTCSSLLTFFRAHRWNWHLCCPRRPAAAFFGWGKFNVVPSESIRRNL